MLRRTSFLAILTVSAMPALGGCGTYVPNIQENPFATEKERSDFVQEIVRNVRCELQDSIVKLYNDDLEVDAKNRNLKWFDSWAAQVSLTLTIDEKTTLSPSLNWLPPTALHYIFNFNLGATLSSEGQRIDKIGSFFLVSEFKQLKACNAADRHKGPFILESDLKLHEWLQAAMISIDNGDTPESDNQNGPFKSNVLSHEIKFDIISTGSATPGWKLAIFSINQTGTFLSATRDRTQDLTITFGPPDPQWTPVIDPATGQPVIDQTTKQPKLRPSALSPAAASAAAAADIGNAITNGVRNALRQ